jgi:hypothetical protein
MARNLRNHVVIGTESGTERTVSGSGPNYVISYEPTGPPTNLIIGDYVYVITAISYAGGEGSSDDITMKYLYDTAGTGDDSPLDLPSGGGSSGSPEQAPHKFVKILGPAFTIFM